MADDTAAPRVLLLGDTREVGGGGADEGEVVSLCMPHGLYAMYRWRSTSTVSPEDRDGCKVGDSFGHSCGVTGRVGALEGAWGMGAAEAGDNELWVLGMLWEGARRSLGRLRVLESKLLTVWGGRPEVSLWDRGAAVACLGSRWMDDGPGEGFECKVRDPAVRCAGGGSAGTLRLRLHGVP